MRRFTWFVFAMPARFLTIQADTKKSRSPHWMTAVGMLDEETYIGAEHQYNIFTVRFILFFNYIYIDVCV